MEVEAVDVEFDVWLLTDAPWVLLDAVASFYLMSICKIKRYMNTNSVDC